MITRRLCEKGNCTYTKSAISNQSRTLKTATDIAKHIENQLRMPPGNGMFDKDGYPEVELCILGPLKGTVLQRLVCSPGRIVKADSAARALYRICRLQQSTTWGITTYPAALRHHKTHFHSIKPFCIVLLKEAQKEACCCCCWIC